MIIQQASRLDFIQEYYFSKKLREIAKMIKEGKPVINLGIGNPDQAPASEVIEAIQKSAANVKNHGYQSYNGNPALREQMSIWYEHTYQVKLNPENEILPLLGSKEGITHIHQAFINLGDKVLVPNPGYPTYSSASRLSGAVPVYYDLDENNDWSPVWSSVSEKDLEEAKIIWINYPQMPTGAPGSLKIFEEAIKIARKYKLLIVNDNPYSLILNQDKPISIFQVEGAKEVAIELNSLSKSHNLAGARVGMIVGDKDYIQTILKVKSNVDSGMYLPVQDLAIAALKLSDEWHIARNQVYASRLSLAKEIMRALNCDFQENQVGMFLWAKIPDTYKNVEELTEKVLQEAYVFITPGFIFGTKGERYIRISLCSKNDSLKEALSRIKKLVL
ncbi:MAG: aminotransferase class I/II-fold pyridoxal phosphate-dependent enzyme [Chitinophagales bacterium]|nr:aminotransferase class I/II-fold pyridoxal phosphate-dependent enzyme [Chitinophagales bacterium]